MSVKLLFVVEMRPDQGDHKGRPYNGWLSLFLLCPIIVGTHLVVTPAEHEEKNDKADNQDAEQADDAIKQDSGCCQVDSIASLRKESDHSNHTDFNQANAASG